MREYEILPVHRLTGAVFVSHPAPPKSVTPLNRLEAIPIEEVRHATVGHVISSLRTSGRQHTLVFEKHALDSMQVCGIFSRSQIEKQLGVLIEANGVAKSFAEIEAALLAS